MPDTTIFEALRESHERQRALSTALTGTSGDSPERRALFDELKTELALDGLHLDPPGKKMMAAAINNAWASITALPDSAWE